MIVFDELVQAQLCKIGRAADLVWLIFRQKERALSLHIQCPCRFEDDGKIIVAGGDVYLPGTKYTGEYSDFDWDVQGNNLFDEKISDLLEKGLFTVLKYEVSRNGDLRIVFENGIVFTAYANHSSGEEQWRLFEKGTNEEHLVVMPDRVEYQ